MRDFGSSPRARGTLSTITGCSTEQFAPKSAITDVKERRSTLRPEGNEFSAFDVDWPAPIVAYQF
jgi:hypothetical protein